MNDPYRPEPFDPEDPIVYQPYMGYGSFHRIRCGPDDYSKDEWEHHPREVKQFDKLPLKIQTIAKRVLEDSLEQWAGKVVFHSANIYRPERFFKGEILAQSNYRLVPKYQLWFVFSFSEKRIKEYCFEMSFDQYRQILKFDFPRYLFYLEQTLNEYERGHKLALEYVKAKNYKPDLIDLELKYAADSGRLNWEFYYLQKEADTAVVNQKRIRVVIVDLMFNMVIYDQELHATSSKVPARMEKETVISETIWNGKKIQVVCFTAIEEDLPWLEDEEEGPPPPPVQ
ncbi:hypothetical protein LL912_09095 [Niabella sp. CC-SYL272]|uniref:hypothetical protein n=1 Tax=Niabella agricola TaxID=2891571 RepID=UPI001F48D298|nr:hypothetical protein [Niabella agricola]MCF3108932.1 hypothetical protein [Niabella agricola]